jgi:hypothetical protein
MNRKTNQTQEFLSTFPIKVCLSRLRSKRGEYQIEVWAISSEMYQFRAVAAHNRRIQVFGELQSTPDGTWVKIWEQHSINYRIGASIGNALLWLGVLVGLVFLAQTTSEIGRIIYGLFIFAAFTFTVMTVLAFRLETSALQTFVACFADPLADLPAATTINSEGEIVPVENIQQKKR